jgi:hypothetical protein
MNFKFPEPTHEGAKSLSTGSPNGCTSVVLKLSAVSAKLPKLGVNKPQTTAAVAMNEENIKSVRVSNNRTFIFNFSPPLNFCPELVILGQKEKIYMEVSSRILFHPGWCLA